MDFNGGQVNARNGDLRATCRDKNASAGCDGVCPWESVGDLGFCQVGRAALCSKKLPLAQHTLGLWGSLEGGVRKGSEHWAFGRRFGGIQGRGVHSGLGAVRR